MLFFEKNVFTVIVGLDRYGNVFEEISWGNTGERMFCFTIPTKKRNEAIKRSELEHKQKWIAETTCLQTKKEVQIWKSCSS